MQFFSTLSILAVSYTHLKVGVTAPPFHVHCRSTTVPYFDDEFDAVGERAARDEETGKTYFVPVSYTHLDSIEYLIRLGVEGLKRVVINNGFSKSDKVQNQLTEYEEEDVYKRQLYGRA